ncbi:amino acid ABC transporter ATP-binding protein [Photobacterium lutimaris]|uniref:ABC transporter domain-containing protein n=1 Tax=Photobacterium lutimaris TaxID=388278 RepID=A0A2T3J335_9GAMM|nr:ATP-binding cassette domain-containing protein [Photobacterium lutimaris]PSU35712.1 hypothetical protein C9I99_01455 [Photobacterium lutimaris]TDR78774.1 polar amino acid transport system ATP-binding protein [Photobacterium lutimaris]
MIEINNVSKHFDGVPVISNVSFDIRSSEAVVICGPSGSGKSTLLRMIAGLTNPSAGAISIDGEPVQRRTFNGRIGLVLQEPFLYSHLSAVNNIALAPCRVKGISKKKAQALALNLLQEFNLLEKADAYPHELSGGQKQRISILRALAMEPEVVLLDEPTSALDTISTQEVIGTIKRLTERHCTVVVVTHELSISNMIADRVVCMDRGEVHEISTPYDLVTRPRSLIGKELFSQSVSSVSTHDRIRLTKNINVGVRGGLHVEHLPFITVMERKLASKAKFHHFENISPEVLLRLGIVDIYIDYCCGQNVSIATKSYQLLGNASDYQVTTFAKDIIWNQLVLGMIESDHPPIEQTSMSKPALHLIETAII